LNKQLTKISKLIDHSSKMKQKSCESLALANRVLTMVNIYRFKTLYQIHPSQGPGSFFVSIGKALSLCILLFSLLIALVKQIWTHTDQWIFMAALAFLTFTFLGWFFKPKSKIVDL
jgi:hypothetical protein